MTPVILLPGERFSKSCWDEKEKVTHFPSKALQPVDYGGVGGRGGGEFSLSPKVSPKVTVLWSVLSLPLLGVTRGAGMVKWNLSAVPWVRFISEMANGSNSFLLVSSKWIHVGGQHGQVYFFT